MGWASGSAVLRAFQLAALPVATRNGLASAHENRRAGGMTYLHIVILTDNRTLIFTREHYRYGWLRVVYILRAARGKQVCEPRTTIGITDVKLKRKAVAV